MRIRVKGGGHTSQIYAIRQSIAKALVAYYQKFVDVVLVLGSRILTVFICNGPDLGVIVKRVECCGKEIKMSIPFEELDSGEECPFEVELKVHYCLSYGLMHFMKVIGMSTCNIMHFLTEDLKNWFPMVGQVMDGLSLFSSRPRILSVLTSGEQVTIC
ncbi:uncharacterized protein LOC104894581 isoform X3 [Beta vulgaris subsp. vulgaris]|uniref:uncharacterized protein LOC104894581 isoform X3 n=1 Tax=Beta vulgaris subsp. vulgaris TaxID=3555 RepID=UPI002037197F|nr:uncharacterized protein LOC104894581 isoform X3 [Beta vulgaris subsp. vulgaris]